MRNIFGNQDIVIDLHAYVWRILELRDLPELALDGWEPQEQIFLTPGDLEQAWNDPKYRGRARRSNVLVVRMTAAILLNLDWTDLSSDRATPLAEKFDELLGGEIPPDIKVRKLIAKSLGDEVPTPEKLENAWHFCTRPSRSVERQTH